MDGGFITCGFTTKEWLPHRPIVAVVSSEWSVTSDASTAPG